MTRQDPRAEVHVGADTQDLLHATEIGAGTFRVLIIGDFGGAGARRQPIAQRVTHRIDRDGIDAAMSAIAPAVALSTNPDDGLEVISFGEMGDFHPDRLVARAPMLARLRALRTAIESRRDEVSGSGTQPTPAEPDTRGLLDRILEREPPLPPGIADTPPRTTGDDLSDFVRRAVRPHVTREVDPQQRALVSQVDDVLAATLRVLLHDPAFQALESVWRATDFFLRRCDAGDDFVVGLLDVTRDELATLDAGVGGAVAARLAADRDAPWSLVIAAYAFGPSDIARLAAIAATAEAMGSPWLAAADARLAGASTFANSGDIDDWDRAADPDWSAVRRNSSARFLGLALPRFLVRLPYGVDNPVESLTFEELPPDAAAHEGFLWGNGAFLAALVAALPVDRGTPAPSHGAIGGLPLHLRARAGGTDALPCAEALLSQRTVVHMLSLGLTPLAGERHGDIVRIPRLQSIADPPVPLPIRAVVRE